MTDPNLTAMSQMFELIAPLAPWTPALEECPRCEVCAVPLNIEDDDSPRCLPCRVDEDGGADR